MKKLLVYTAITMSLLFGKRVSAQTEVIFYTTMGVFEVELYDTLQPITAGNFISLVVEKFYDEIIFHRVVEGFVIQGGDPMGTGFGGWVARSVKILRNERSYIGHLRLFRGV